MRYKSNILEVRHLKWCNTIRSGQLSYILFEETTINPNVKEWKMEKGFYIVDIFTNCGLIYCSDSNDHYS